MSGMSGARARRDGRGVSNGVTARVLPATARAVLLALTLGLSACTPVPGIDAADPSVTAAVEATSPTAEQVTLVSVTDGDTIVTSAGRVRLIGIDVPEVGVCGFAEATEEISRVISIGDPITLELPEGQNDEDRHGRLLRYVITEDGTDIGMMQIEAGHAVARYDSTDGYPYHPYEDLYRERQLATLEADGTVLTPACAEQRHEEERREVEQADAPQAPAPVRPPVPDESPWYMQYGSCTQLKKNTVGHPKGPFDVNNPNEVEIYNWFQYGTGHSGDGDNDGLACE